MNKKNIRLILLIWDIVAIILIFFSVFMMFETVINRLFIDSNIDDYVKIIDNVQIEYKNSIDYLDEKPDIPYKDSIMEIMNYLKVSTLNKSKYENNLVMILSQDPALESIIGTRNNLNPSLKKGEIDYNKFYFPAAKIPQQIKINDFKQLENKLDKNDLKYVQLFYKPGNKLKIYELRGYPDKDEAERLSSIFSNKINTNHDKYVEFSYHGKEYIGFAGFLSTEINKNLDKNNVENFYPVFVVADIKSDFFYLINRIRNIFFIILGSIFIIVTFIKIYNTFIITKELKQISGTIRKETNAIEEKGEIGTALMGLNFNFKETSYLYDSYSNLSGKLLDLGDIISGIADKDLFVAALKNDKSILDPHEINMAILFLDVMGFTTISETYKEKAMSIINHIWDEVETAVYKYNGKINKYMGDAALIIFPEKAADSTGNSPQNAVMSAVSIFERVEFIKKELGIEFNFRIGIDYGKLVYGKTGSARNFELGVIGDPVNTAARFESLNKQYKTNIILSGTVLKKSGFNPGKPYQLLNEPAKEYSFYFIDRARPKGKKEAKEMYTILLNTGKQHKILGSEDSYAVESFDFYSQFLKEFFSNIKYWQDDKKNEGTEKWINMAKQIGKFYHEKKFPLFGIFLNKLLTHEELMRYKTDPVSWLKKENIQIEIPDTDWIKYGTIELSK